MNEKSKMLFISIISPDIIHYYENQLILQVRFTLFAVALSASRQWFLRPIGR